MIFEIDVSGEELLSKNYPIFIANRDNIIKGFKFKKELVNVLCFRYGQNFYRYKKSRKEKALFKIRLYSVVVYHLLKNLKISQEISLSICRDFDGRELDIKENLRFFLSNLSEINIGDRIYFVKLSANSNAHKYAFLMRHDKKDQLPNYIKISLQEIEKWLK